MEKSLDEIIGARSSERSAGRKRGGKGRNGGGRRGPIKSGREGSRSGGSNVVMVSNVHPDISEDDLRDLFRQAGPVTQVRLDRGSNASVAWVKFQFSADAFVAQGRFDKRSAAGKVISAKLVKAFGETNSAPLESRLGDGGRKKRSDRKAAPGSSKRERRGNKSAEELDAELDSYMADEQTPAGSADASASATAPADSASAPAAPAPAAPQEELMIE